MERSLTKEISVKEDGKNVLLKGWIHNIRDLGDLKFIVLRDSSGIIQITAKENSTDKKVLKIIENLSRESSVEIEGRVKKSKQAPGGREILPVRIKVLAEAEEIPIDVSEHSKTELPKRLDHRSIDLYNQNVSAIFKIQSEITNSFRRFFYERGFYEIHPPSIISSASEGGTNLFEVKYFEDKVFLAQSPQLYKQMLISSLEKVFMTVPVWRAEKHNTVRHLNECRQLDIEVAFANQQEVIDYLIEAVKYIIKEVKEKCEPELAILKRKLEVPKHKKFTYDETIKLLQKHIKIKHGEDLSPDAEKKLAKLYPNTIISISDWPLSLKPFYIMPKDEKPNAKLSEGFDVHYGGMEISSGGQRIHIPKLIEKRLKANKLNPKHFGYYIDSFRYGCPIHAGWSIGLERLTMTILNLPNIREAVLFPRDRDRITP